MPLVASQQEKKVLYQLSKRGLGFNDEERREAWLLATGARQAMVTCHYTQSYKAMLSS